MPQQKLSSAPGSILANTIHTWSRTARLTRTLRERENLVHSALAMATEQRILAEALRDAATAFNHSLNLNEVLEAIMTSAGRVVPHDAINVMLIEGDRVRIVGHQGYEAQNIQHIDSAISWRLAEMSYLRKAALTPEPLLIPDTHMAPGWQITPETAWVRSYAAIGIFHQGQAFGFINLDSGKPNFFDPQVIEPLKIFANQAAIAIENSRLFEEARKRLAEQTALLAASTAISSSLNLTQVLQALAHQTVTALETTSAVFSSWNPANHATETLSEYYSENASPKERVSRIGSVTLVESGSLLHNQLISGQARVVHIDDTDLDTDDHHLLSSRGIHSMLTIPLALKGNSLGYLNLCESRSRREFSSDDISLVQAIAGQAAVALENARLYTEMQLYAITDPLTGVYNRRGWDELGRREVERARRFQRPLAAVFFDLDHFKRINDQFGHLAGDDVLRGVAHRVADSIREVDILGRFGGEEFVILMPETDQNAATLAAERLCTLIGGSPFPTRQGSISVTISLGVADLDSAMLQLENLVGCADAAMYAAKAAGRNRVIVAPGAGPGRI